MSLAIFDLDNTLLAGDSDYSWGQYLVTRGIVDGPLYERMNKQFYEAYKAGTLDILEFLAFSLKPLAEHPRAQLEALRSEFMHDIIQPMIGDAARALVQKHIKAGDTPMIITATNSFVTSPIAQAFGIEHLLATEPEQVDGRYTGGVAGIPCFQQGKVERLHQWLAQHSETLENSTFYSDSHNDLPLLEIVTHPVAVGPDEMLRQMAMARHWPILELHDNQGT